MSAGRDEAFLETAAFLGRRICRDALWAGPRCNWLGDSMEFVDNNWGVVHRALGPDLYGGTSGIALFLAALHGATGERLFRTTAEGAIAHGALAHRGHPARARGWASTRAARGSPLRRRPSGRPSATGRLSGAGWR